MTYNQGRKQLTHLSKTGAFINNFIHFIISFYLNTVNLCSRSQINVVCGKRKT